MGVLLNRISKAISYINILSHQWQLLRQSILQQHVLYTTNSIASNTRNVCIQPEGTHYEPGPVNLVASSHLRRKVTWNSVFRQTHWIVKTNYCRAQIWHVHARKSQKRDNMMKAMQCVLTHWQINRGTFGNQRLPRNHIHVKKGVPKKRKWPKLTSSKS